MAIDLVVAGAAALARLNGTMTPVAPGVAGTFVVDTDAGWPVSGKFAVVIDRGLDTEETILINSRSGTTWTVGQRGYDGTTGQDHGNNATIELDLPATVVTSLIQHENGTDADPHPTTLLNNARHDVAARHAFGAAFNIPAAPPAITLDASSASGVASGPARSDHAHGLLAATATTITGVNAEGASASAARADHNHVIGGTNHIPIASLVNGSIANGAAALATGQELHYKQAANPGAVGAGALWFNTTKRTLLIRNAANTAWDVLINLGPWIPYVPTLVNFNVGGSGFNYARYTRIGTTVIINGFAKLGPGGSVTGSIAVGLPPLAPAADLRSTYTVDEFSGHGAARGSDVSANAAFGAIGVIEQGTLGFDNTHLAAIATAGQVAWNATTPFVWTPADGDRFSYFMEYETSNAEDTNFV